MKQLLKLMKQLLGNVPIVPTLLLFIAGMFLLWIAQGLREQFPTGEYILNGLSVALLTAAFLSLTVETALLTRIARNAFEAAFGYVLPGELRPELRSIYQTRIVCVHHDQRCDLEQAGESVTLHTEIRRTLRNVTEGNCKASVFLDVDEWFNKDGQSEIISLGYSYSKSRESVQLVSPTGGLGSTAVKRDGAVLKVLPVDVELGPGDEVVVWQEFREVRHLNDSHHMFFRTPTVRPTVTVCLSPRLSHLSAVVNFSHLLTDKPITVGETTYQLPATLLAMQPIEIRWWNQLDVKRWEAECGPHTTL